MKNVDFPKMLYRAEGAEVKNLVVQNEAELAEANKAGWGDRRSANEAAAKAPPAPVNAQAAPNPKLAEENLELVNRLATIEEAHRELIEAKDDVIQVQGNRVIELQNALGKVREHADCSDALKAVIDAALEPAPEQKADAQKAPGGKGGRGGKPA